MSRMFAMNKKRKILFQSTFILNKFSMISMIFIMLLIPLFRKQVFIDRETFSSIEVIVLFGISFIFLFLIFSLAFLYTEIRESNDSPFKAWMLFVFGIISLFLFFTEKVIIDEIAHEYVAGRPVIGEWIILYLFFSIQLIYHQLTFFRLKNSSTKK